MSQVELTPQQSSILKLIREFMAEHNYAPTVRELCRLAGLKSPDTVQYHLDNLRAKGMLGSVHGKPRTLALPMLERVAMIPILGRVPAGPAVGSYADAEGHVPASVEKENVESLFALKIKGDSMEPTLMDRDTVVVRWQTTASSNDIVVARLDGDESTVKRLRLRPGGAMLIPTTRSIPRSRWAPAPSPAKSSR